MTKLPERYLQTANEIMYYSHLLYNKGFAEANGGNISVRLDENLIMSTPTMESKGLLKAEEMVITDNAGNHIYGIKKSTSEILSHLAVYRTNSAAISVVHSHPPYVCSYAYTADSLPELSTSPESVLWIGELCDIPAMMPGSEKLSGFIEKNSIGKQVIILRNHGLITWGGSLREAWWRTEVFEHHCKVSHLTDTRGVRQNQLSNEIQDELELLKINLLNRG